MWWFRIGVTQLCDGSAYINSAPMIRDPNTQTHAPMSADGLQAWRPREARKAWFSRMRSSLGFGGVMWVVR